jgi:hypothetical protein
MSVDPGDPRGESLPAESRSDYFVRELHNKLHHARCGSHGPVHRH